MTKCFFVFFKKLKLCHNKYNGIHFEIINENIKKAIDMQTGKIGVTSENIFPIIKKYLYSNHEIFLRELISNAIDATQKLKTLANLGEYKDELGDLTIKVKLDKEKKTITVSDRGIGMTAEEVDKYINQIAFSSANEFLEKYKNQENVIIGHFGLGFYSAFMVADKVEIITKSYKENSIPVKWSCNGTPEYTIEETTKNDRGTDVILYINDESKEFLNEIRIEELLKKYCRFLPIPIAFGKIKEWKDGKEIETDKDNIINDTNPLWIRRPSELKEEDYLKFYKELYPISEDPLFYIHLNVDYPFKLTGILYFPKIRSNFDIQKNKIQLYCNQVFVTDSVEGIVPEYLTFLHGIIDSPDIPLNVSRSYLQSDPNVEKISNHITRKVADRLNEIFNNNRNEFEKKWDDLKLFIQFGMMTDDKFYERAIKFTLFKNVDGKYFTIDEYKNIVKSNQTDKNNNLVLLYASSKEKQYTFIQAAKDRGYDVLLMDGQLDIHFINHLEQKMSDIRFTRIDADVIDKLIPRDIIKESKLTDQQKKYLTTIFRSKLKDDLKFIVEFENMNENDQPVVITQSEFMRRMKEMSQLGSSFGIFKDIPESYNIIINTNHPLILRIANDLNEKHGNEIENIEEKIKTFESNKSQLDEQMKNKKQEEIPQDIKDHKKELENKIEEFNQKLENLLKNYANENKLVQQLIDIALLSNNMLTGEDLNAFIKRSIELL